MTLGSQVVHLIGLHLLDDPDQAAGIGHIAVMQDKGDVCFMGVLKDMVDAVRIKERGPPFQAMDLVAFFQKKFRQIGAVLPCHPGNQCFFFIFAPDAPRCKPS